MKNINMPAEIMSYVCSNKAGKFVFVDDFSGWNEEATALPGVEFLSAMEGNGLKSLATGETWIPQCCSVRVGNHLTVGLRDGSKYNSVKLSELPLFRDFPVVILTNNEALRAFAPVCNSKLELALWLAAIEEETEKRNAAAGGFDWPWSQTASDMSSLAIFLYRSNPNKKTSVIDNLD